MSRYDRFMSDIFDDGVSDHPLTIDVVPAGVMEEIPAEWDVRSGFARLTKFRIGDFIGDRGVAVLMAGEPEIIRQEKLVAERWYEGSGDRAAARMEQRWDAEDGR